MKLLFVLLFLVGNLNEGLAQQWNNLQQASLGVTYDLPQAWYVGGHTSKKACTCVGATVNSSADSRLSMLVMVGEEVGEDFLTQPVWGYEFVSTTTAPKTLALPHLTFEERISTWKQSPKELVLQFVGRDSTTQRTYVLYFWGSLSAIQDYSSTIEHIVHSFQPLH